MRQALIIFLLLAAVQFTAAQQIIIRKTDSAGCFSFVRIKDGRLSRHIGSYEVTRDSEFHRMMRWGVSGGDTLYWTNGENIYACRMDNQDESTLLYHHLYFILEFFVRGKFVYVVYNPTREEGIDDNRFNPGLRFCRINLRTHVKEDLCLPRGYNVTNLTISPDEQWVSFIDTRNAEENASFRLVVYNRLKDQATVIDSADPKRNTWFGNDDQVNSAFWKDSTTLLYYKHIKPNDYGEVIAYDVRSKAKQVWLKDFPKRDFRWFSVCDGYLYYSGRFNIYRTKDGIKQETLFEDRRFDSNILSAVVLPYGSR